MSIATIRGYAKSIVAYELGADFKELPFLFDINTDDARSLAAGYSVVWGSASQIENIGQVVNLDHQIKVTITRRVFARGDDQKFVSSVDSIYSTVSKIIKRFVMDKMDHPEAIQKVSLVSLEEPERIGEGRDIAAIKLVFQVRYLIT